MSDSKYEAHWNLAKLIISLDTALLAAFFYGLKTMFQLPQNQPRSIGDSLNLFTMVSMTLLSLISALSIAYMLTIRERIEVDEAKIQKKLRVYCILAVSGYGAAMIGTAVLLMMRFFTPYFGP